MTRRKQTQRLRDLLARIEDDELREELTRLLRRTGEVPSRKDEFTAVVADLTRECAASYQHMERMQREIHLTTATDPGSLAFNIQLPRLPQLPSLPQPGWLPMQPDTRPQGHIFWRDYAHPDENDDPADD